MELTIFGASNRNDGFGVAGREMIQSLERTGHTMERDADIQITFSAPHLFKNQGRYNIGYYPWESTQPLNYSWLGQMQLMDELWVTSPYQQQVAKYWGFETHVYEHGINPIWTPQYRQPQEKITFLFMGLEALRKGAAEALRAFNMAFRGYDDVQLIIKAQQSYITSPFPNITIVDDNLSTGQLVKLFHSADVMLAPSWGEGFGMPTRDAAGTGMPVIATEGFLPYEHLLDQHLLIKSTMVESPWEFTHPGLMHQPSIDDMIDKLRHIYEHFDFYASYAYIRANKIHTEYDWDYLTNKHFLALESRLG